MGVAFPGWLEMTGLITALVFLGLTGLLLLWDLDQPRRFMYVLLRPQWRSWLVKGAYIIVGFSALLPVEILLRAGGYSNALELAVRIGLMVMAMLAAVYTAFLFAQARGRDFWQSPALPIHMLTHSLTAGAALFALFLPGTAGEPIFFVKATLIGSILVHLAGDAFELFAGHATQDSARTAFQIVRGRYRHLFWLGAVGLGSIVPIVCALLPFPSLLPVAGLSALAGVFIGQHIWVRAPQQIPLS
jgi:formate-dependent nitrite reductase membrane component NrfD